MAVILVTGNQTKMSSVIRGNSKVPPFPELGNNQKFPTQATWTSISILPLIQNENLHFRSPQNIEVWNSCRARKINFFQVKKTGNVSMSQGKFSSFKEVWEK